ncbi:uncharacterized protein LOC129599648 isoform X3 [Paramacrobiotus metropolitanus]|uniref:uncharacterized protein LOC129599648 isoform X3 n=1 Tax=Paramacrobiotus metropolitanus TaxID=2943436 RepID=UPI002445E636|nr:uncharacterized protein LOC129599648 isoform X3 [Paramacrobiotus metropolitanus]
MRHADICLYQPLTDFFIAVGVVQLVVSTIAASLTASIRFRALEPGLPKKVAVLPAMAKMLQNTTQIQCHSPSTAMATCSFGTCLVSTGESSPYFLVPISYGSG